MKLQVKVIKTVPDYAEEEINKFLTTLDPKDIHRIKYLYDYYGSSHELVIVIEYFVRNE